MDPLSIPTDPPTSPTSPTIHPSPLVDLSSAEDLCALSALLGVTTPEEDDPRHPTSPTLLSLPYEILLHILASMPYHACWRLAFVDKLLRQCVFDHIEQTLRRNIVTGRWSFVMEVQLTDSYGEREIYLGHSPHLNRRTLDLHISLEGTNQLTNIDLSWPPPMLPVIIRLALHKSPPVTARQSRSSWVFLERVLGTGCVDTRFGYEEHEDAIAVASKVARWSLVAEVGDHAAAAYVSYSEWHWGGHARELQRGGIEFSELRFLMPRLLAEIDWVENKKAVW
ncbi:hypothetical protein BC936DRAFT_144593 [Jimgerdemannia flammicorona]|uniref:F-box domain-containing protein n=1 Tax=Jimgerdemannia flammicorona TaxID=994334 RepID=A0A433DC56_9FUNG|nr:hypothetical protein BC936DRAFT_144593 [Jimgerdemannia flammicorona]